jgi:chemotaxis protein MotB
MSARGNRRRPSHHEEEHENEERWLLTYADMITLLMTLFMVMFAISSVNTSKFDALSKSLSEALSGKIVTGGPSIQQTGAEQKTDTSSPTPPIPTIQPTVKVNSSTSESSSSSSSSSATSTSSSAAAREQEDFHQLKLKIDTYAKDHGLQGKLQADIVRRGLVIRLLTDNVLFASGSAHLEPPSTGLLTTLGHLLALEVRHPIVVEGHTDNRPISSPQFPTNWELSTSRATQVVRYFIRQRVAPSRLQAAGLAAQRPIASNSNDTGRSRNRRVEIVLVRQNSDPSTSTETP